MNPFSGDSTRVVHPLFQTEDSVSIPTSPLHLHVGRISLGLAIDLNRLWHSRLPMVDASNVTRNKYSVCFGAEYKNRWYASAIWSSPVARMLDDTTTLELRRFAIAPDAPKNTASRVIRIMVAQIKREWSNLTTLVSYQDTEVHAGTIYAAAGWSPVGHRRGGVDAWVSKRKRNKSQASGDKVRWEMKLTA